jgi:hypothetical protein
MQTFGLVLDYAVDMTAKNHERRESEDEVSSVDRQKMVSVRGPLGVVFEEALGRYLSSALRHTIKMVDFMTLG